MSKGRYFCGGSALAVTLAMALSGQASAQNNNAASDDDVTTVEEVVSTGTLIQGVGEEAALAVESYSREDLLNQGSPSAAGFVRGLSEVGLQGGQSNRGKGGTQDGVQTINLRGFGAGRTLVLMNGVRLADEPTTAGGDINSTGGAVQNINSIPMEVLGQVEVLKDGGGAIYGSDAVAGAVNFVTRRDLNGFEASANYTWIADTDGDYNMNIQWGQRNDNGNLLVSLYYAHSSPLAAKDRDWAKGSPALNGAGGGANAPYQTGFGTYVFSRPSLISRLDTVAGATAPGQVGFNTLAGTSGVLGATGPFGTTAINNGAAYNSFVPFVTSNRINGPGRTGVPISQMGTTAVLVFNDGTTAANNVGVFNGRAINDPAFGSNGELRPSTCVELGGFAGFTSGGTPTCYYNLADVEDIKDESDVYRIFADLNYDITDTLRFHSSVTFSKTNTFIQGRELTAATACDPLPDNAQSYYASRTTPVLARNAQGVNEISPNAQATLGNGALVRSCFTPGYLSNATATGASTGLSVPGYNPAVRDYVLRFRDSAGNRVFNDEEINTLTGLPQGTSTSTFNGGTRAFAPVQLGQGYVPVTTSRCIGANRDGVITADGGGTIGGQACIDPDNAAAVAAENMASRRVGNYGKVTLTGYQPFLALYNTAFGEEGENYYLNQSSAFTLTNDLKGDLGERFGNFIDFTVRGTYQRNVNTSQGPGLLTDRLQRALNGFASNYDDLGVSRDGCTVDETAGVRLLRTSPAYGSGSNYVAATYMTVSGVPYTVGAGGGADYDLNTPGIQTADFGFNPNIPGATATYAGNGCFFFNPFPSAIRMSRINGAQIAATDTQVGFVGADTQAYGEGRSGNYQGYARGYGLENSPGILAWLFAPMRTDSAVDNIQLELTFNGTVANFQLPGGDISWAVSADYSYSMRTLNYNRLLDRITHPCSFLSTVTDVGNGSGLTGPGSTGFAAGGSAADSLPPKENLSNSSSTCSGTSGLSTQVTGFTVGTGPGNRETINHGIVGEVNLPLLDNLNLHFSGRYDESLQPNSERFIGGSVFSGDIKWQATNNFAFTANATQSFDAPVLDAAGEFATWCRDIPTSFIITTIPCTLMNPVARRAQVFNPDLGPERGLNYGFGTVFTTDDRRTQLRLQYFNDRVTGRAQQFAAAALARVLTGVFTPNTPSPPDQILDCNNPQVQLMFDAARAPRIFDGRPFIEYQNAQGDRVSRCINPGEQVFNSATGTSNVVNGGITLRGINTNNNSYVTNRTNPDGSPILDEDYRDDEDYGIVMLFPSRVNAGDISTSGLDLSASHTFADLVFGGELSLSADATWALTNNQDATLFSGASLQNAFDYIATQSSTPGTGPAAGATSNINARANILQGSISANYRHGNNNFYISGRWSSPTADNSTLGSVLGTLPPNGAFNLNPANPAICDALNNGAGLPFTPSPVNVEDIKAAIGDFGVGKNAYDEACNLGNVNSNYLQPQFVMDASFRTQLPWDTTLSIAISNLLDTDPPFQVYEFNYNPAGSLTPDGRTIQVGLQKKF